MPTGTFRGDGWDDLDKPAAKARNKRKLQLDDDIDVDNLLDDLEEKKGIKSKPTHPQQNNSLWSAGGGFGGTSSRHGDFGEDLDKLDDLEDPLERGERVKFSEGKNRQN
jgi:hypothetical protein